MFIINTDASIEPVNPGGIVAWGFIVKAMGKGKIYSAAGITERGGPMATNNVGEYQAVIAAMLWLLQLPKDEKRPAIIQSDSQLIVNQCSRQWNCNDPKLVPLRDMVLEAVEKYPCSIKFKWIPRTKNYEADDISRSVYNQAELEEMRKALCSPQAIFGDDDIPF